VHWWYKPDSYDEFIPAATAPADLEPDQPNPGALHPPNRVIDASQRFLDTTRKRQIDYCIWSAHCQDILLSGWNVISSTRHVWEAGSVRQWQAAAVFKTFDA